MFTTPLMLLALAIIGMLGISLPANAQELCTPPQLIPKFSQVCYTPPSQGTSVVQTYVDPNDYWATEFWASNGAIGVHFEHMVQRRPGEDLAGYIERRIPSLLRDYRNKDVPAQNVSPPTQLNLNSNVGQLMYRVATLDGGRQYWIVYFYTNKDKTSWVRIDFKDNPGLGIHHDFEQVVREIVATLKLPLEVKSPPTKAISSR